MITALCMLAAYCLGWYERQYLMTTITVKIPTQIIEQAKGHWVIGTLTQKPSRWRRFWMKRLLGWVWEDHS
jgi:hypothetical protein